MSRKLAKNLAVGTWTLLFLLMGLTVYVNYFLPHGPSYDTGEVVCQNDDRGPCGELYKEDMRNLNIPGWAKFLREDFVLVFFALGIAGIYLSSKADEPV